LIRSYHAHTSSRFVSTTYYTILILLTTSSTRSNFRLPDPAGRAGGACTSTLLNVLYKDEQTPEDAYSFIEVLQRMRTILEDKGYQQVPQLTSTNELDLSHKFDLVPEGSTGTRRALMIGINYVGHEGELRGCHNDVGNMVRATFEVCWLAGWLFGWLVS
jgi:hypothetical protein